MFYFIAWAEHFLKNKEAKQRSNILLNSHINFHLKSFNAKKSWKRQCVHTHNHNRYTYT